VGSGSNLLVPDAGVRGLVISSRTLRGLERVSDVRVQVEAGVSTGRLLKSATDWALGGIEFLGGVPGSVGGGLVMSAGTYLGEFKDVTVDVTTVELATGVRKVRTHAECGFAYRRSDIPKDEMIISCTLDLIPRSVDEISQAVRGLRDNRHAREPKGVPNAGS